MIIRAIDLESRVEGVVVAIETAFRIIEVIRAEHITHTHNRYSRRDFTSTSINSLDQTREGATSQTASRTQNVRRTHSLSLPAYSTGHFVQIHQFKNITWRRRKNSQIERIHKHFEGKNDLKVKQMLVTREIVRRLTVRCSAHVATGCDSIVV